jgi:hypothetical protein
VLRLDFAPILVPQYSEKTILMRFEVSIGTIGENQIKAFLSESGRSHQASDSLYPGYTFELAFWPPAQEWSLVVRCGSTAVEIHDFCVVDSDV